MLEKRIQHLIHKDQSHHGVYILYWMQQSQRVEYNHALIHAIHLANERNLPLYVYFGLTSQYPGANQRHYAFMLEGLKETFSSLQKLGISVVFQQSEPDVGILSWIENADAIVFDLGYLRIQRLWRKHVYQAILEKPAHPDLYSVESDVVVPVRIASEKLEYGAYTLRPKINRLRDEFLQEASLPSLRVSTSSSQIDGSAMECLNSLNHTVLKSRFYQGGYISAKKQLAVFMKNFAHYKDSSDPSVDITSHLSMYLHFGQISPVEIALSIRNLDADEQLKEAFLEQLIVRRELAMNFVFYNENYDQFDFITEPWAYRTMQAHQSDPREYVYTQNDYLSFSTHDPYFNAAMKEMVFTGYMHNYMRMYWAKKIIEWSPSMKEAYETILFLNDTYFIDGRDANSYAGVAWCFGKHDRPWQERSIFGQLRYMNQAGLLRKFNMELYLTRIHSLEQIATAPEKTRV